MRLLLQSLAVLLLAMPLAAQDRWQPGSEIPLVRRAAVQRNARDADTLLASWRATARGVVRFASEIDHGGGPVERVIRADELRVEVYGEAPSRSKQIIVAWRDTSFLPNRLNYHRDHLGIVANDFGGVIRLGEGDEVRDIIHPLSPAGLSWYRFALGDTVMLRTPQGEVRVVAVQIRPADPSVPAAVGTLYLDLDRAALVRFRFTFTPASYRDPSVEEITVALENSLLDNARWLPWRQSIVIRRGTPWLDLPIRTLLRADWLLSDYALGVTQDANRFAGPPVAGLQRPAPDSGWGEPLVARLGLLPMTDADVVAAESDAMRLLQGRWTTGLPGTRLAARGVSNLLQVNRVQGVTPQLGARIGLGRGVAATIHGGIGLSDHRLVGDATLAIPVAGVQLALRGGRGVQDLAMWPATPAISGALNSLRTAVAGQDRGDYTLIEGFGAEVGVAAGDTRLRFGLGAEWSTSVAAAFTPLDGTSAANPALGVGRSLVMRGEGSRRSPAGDGWRLNVEAGSGAREWIRFAGDARIARQLGQAAFQVTVRGGIGTRDLPGYRSFALGGRGTLPGVAYRSIGGTRMAWADISLLLPINPPSPPIPNARRIRLPSALGPFLAAGVAGGELGLPWSATGRIEPVAGLRLDLWGPLLRIEAGVSLRRGDAAVTFDVHPDWWPVL